MKVTISGKPGSGKSTIGKAIAKELKLKHYSMGDLQRSIAKDKGISLIELSKIEEQSPDLDKKVDDKLKHIGETEDNIIIDARLGFHFIPDSIKIFLNISLDEGTKRIFKDKREGEKEDSLEMLKFQIKRRIESEEKRYLEYYQIYVNNASNYDLIVDTTNLTFDQVLSKIIEFLKTFQ